VSNGYGNLELECDAPAEKPGASESAGEKRVISTSIGSGEAPKRQGAARECFPSTASALNPQDLQAIP